MSQPVTGPYVEHPQFGPVQPTNTMAILSLVFAFLFWPLGIAFGHAAKSQIKRTGEGGSGLATAGLVISYLWAGMLLLIILLLIAGAAAAA